MLNVQKATLPIRYLGVPLSSKKLNFNNCQPLFTKVQQRLSSWKANVISYAGRLELIKSTLSSFHLFWTTVFLLPQASLHALDRQTRDFFWNCWSSYLHPIAWSSICQPVSMGGLGVRSSSGIAKAALLRQVWNVVINKKDLLESLGHCKIFER
eukprot:TRINITY_DN5259_c0_g2_i2.p1 TRINITY_DN5259_c0_g2~~TRINITY_DN5259_c0_g2_i2.p1  ORF type:complete len:179 (+),score=24.04 TRINITY_DN5259_c0_g2_i2:77-538(+)